MTGSALTTLILLALTTLSLAQQLDRSDLLG